MWDIVFYEKENGEIPVQEFLETLEVKKKAKALRGIDLLEEFGSKLGMPQARQMEGKIWELRVIFGGDISRIFYFIHTKRKIILLHGFVKKSDKTPPGEIEIANKYYNDYLRRSGNEL